MEVQLGENKYVFIAKLNCAPVGSNNISIWQRKERPAKLERNQLTVRCVWLFKSEFSIERYIRTVSNTISFRSTGPNPDICIYQRNKTNIEDTE